MLSLGSATPIYLYTLPADMTPRGSESLEAGLAQP